MSLKKIFQQRVLFTNALSDKYTQEKKTQTKQTEKLICMVSSISANHCLSETGK